MAYTDNLRKQHNDIVAVVREITVKLGSTRLDAPGLRSLLSRLAGQVSFHLAMEDDSLYPRLASSDNAQARTVATTFLQEMGGLAEVFTAFSRKWQVSAIEADPQGFTAESRKVLAALGDRIQRENSVLYPLADKLQ